MFLFLYHLEFIILIELQVLSENFNNNAISIFLKKFIIKLGFQLTDFVINN